MTCQIFVTTFDVRADFWQCHDLYEKEHDVIEKSLTDITNCDAILKMGHGFYVMMNKKLFIVSCFHIIGKNNMKMYALHLDKKTGARIKLELKIAKQFPEFDLIVYEFDKTIETEYINIDHDFDMNHVEKNKPVKINDSNLNLCFDSVEHMKITSKYVNEIKIPFYSIKITDGYVEKMQEIGGSIALMNNIPIGMVTLGNISKNILYVFPLKLLFKIIKLSNYKLKIAIFDSVLVADKNDTTGEIDYYGHMIQTSYDISYMSSKNKNFTFEENDVIMEINENKVLKSGLIYCKDTELNFEIRTFCLFENLFNEYIKIKINRNNTFIEVFIKCVNIDDYLSFNIVQNNKFLCYDNMIFFELSNNIIQHFELTQNPCLEIIKKRSFYNFLKKTFKRKLVVVVGEKFEYPTIIKKIGNNEILNLEKLKLILTKQISSKQTTFTCY